MIHGISIIKKTDTSYPSSAYLLNSNELGDLGYMYSSPVSQVFGIVLEGSITFQGKVVHVNEYFSFWSHDPSQLQYRGRAAVFERHGFKGQNLVGGPIEEQGRLSYIDGCSDSLLVYPPRCGDPSMSHLHFPPNTEQTFHTHPSLRLGVVVAGAGVACLEDGEISLQTGDIFCIEEHEKHRFKTLNRTMDIIAYHPDGDWGPTDHNHTMLNRTYLTK